MDLRLNKIILNHGLPMRTFRGASGEGMTVDASALPFILCELVSHGATSVLIPWGPSRDQLAISNLPRSLRSFVTVVNPLDAMRRREVLFRPLADEFRLEMMGSALTYHTKLDPALSHHLCQLYFELEVFLAGMEFRSQIDIELGALQKSIRALRRQTRNPEGIANLAIIEGLFSSYDLHRKAGFQLAKGAAQGQFAIFDRLLQDEIYRKISEENYLIGFPDKMKRALQLITRHSRALLEKPYFRPVCKLVTGGISAATSLPVIDTEELAPLLGIGFLPPVVSISSQIEKAIKAWRHAEPSFVPISDTRRDGLEVISWEEEKRHLRKRTNHE
jgi:hypothetical protein